MNNLGYKIKKALSNKNVVTVLGFILIGVILVFAYNYRLNTATAPVNVPYAITTIEPQTKITTTKIGFKKVPRDFIKDEEIYTNINDILNKYTNLESTIYAGSFFYKEAVVSEEELPGVSILDVPEGETLFTLKVDMISSYYNSFVPGDYFDLYIKTVGTLADEKNKSDEIIVGKFISKIKILAVKTESGENVFGSDESRTPAGILFSVPEEQALLLMKANYFNKLNDVFSIEFSLVPRGKKYIKKDNNEKVVSEITSQQLQDYIEAHSKDIDINEIKNNTELGE